MRRTLFAVPLASLLLASTFAPHAIAQEKKARGTVNAVTPTNLTVQVAGTAMNFAVDSKTHVEAAGASTATRKAEAAGKPGVTLADIIKTGQAVEVSYTEAGGVMHASSIRRVASAGSPPSEPTSSNGKVTAISAGALTISGSGGGGGTFTQSFVVDSNTRVVGKGAGTAARRGGGTAPISDMIGVGDSVEVSFKKMGDKLHATDVRVMMKAVK
jgi:uncharacterized protein DUF5666